MMDGHTPVNAFVGFGRTRIQPTADDGSKPIGKQAPAPRLRVLTLAECAAASPRGYLLKGILAPGDLAVLFGPPGAGKSVVGPYIALSVALGRMAFGRRVRQSVVLYCAAEDGAGMKQRATALRRLHGDTDALRIVAEPIDLMGDGINDTPDLAELRAIGQRINAGLIFIDTMAAAFPGLDENDGRSMGRAVRVLRELGAPAEATATLPAWAGAAVVAVHHGAKVNGTTPRGHGVLDGAADVTMQIEVPADRASPRTVKLGKNRNGSSMEGFSFTIRAETMGEDEDGDAITAPVPEEADPAKAGNKAMSLPIQPRRALDFLTDLIAATGNMLPTGPMFPPHSDLRCVPFEDWREACSARTLSASPEKRAVNQAFQRAVETLSARAYVATAEHEGVKLVWLAKGPGT